MIKQTIEIDTDIVEALEDGFRRFPSVLNTALTRNIARAKSRLLSTLHDQPGKPKYPIRWTSERQRRAFFATKGFGRGIPTRRTGKLVNAWDIKVDTQTTGGVLTVFNSVEYEQYVTGINQQGFHHDTGWYQSQTVLADAMVEIESVIIDTYIAVTEDVFK